MGIGYSFDSTDSQGNTLLHLIYEKYSEYMNNRVEVLIEEILNAGYGLLYQR